MEIDPADDEALTRYVLEHYLGLLTETERATLSVLHLQPKAANSNSLRISEILTKHLETRKTPEVIELLAKGPEACRREIRDRLLRDHAGDIILVTCAKCKRLARTPRARMCVHCGYSWYTKEPSNE